MGMTPDQFFEAFVRGNYEDCQQYPGCVRRAFNAAVSASHFADHYLAYYEKYDQSKVEAFKTLGAFVEFLSTNTDGCFRDIRSISNAYKHLYSPKVYSSIASAGAIESISLEDDDAEVKVIEEKWRGRVIYCRKDAQEIEFLPTLSTVIDYLESFLNSQH